MMAFVSAILGVTIVGLWRNRPTMVAVSLVLLANFGLANAFYGVTNDSHAWMLYLILDYLSALAVVAFRPSRWVTMIALIYAAQILCHGAYAISRQGPWEQYNYWWMLTYTGWAQLIVLYGWTGYELIGGIARRYRGPTSNQAMLSDRP